MSWTNRGIDPQGRIFQKLLIEFVFWWEQYKWLRRTKKVRNKNFEQHQADDIHVTRLGGVSKMQRLLPSKQRKQLIQIPVGFTKSQTLKSRTVPGHND